MYFKWVFKLGFGFFVFDEWCYLFDGSDNFDFNFNKLKYYGVLILIIGDNFGCGFSCEYVVWVLKDYGFNIIIVGSFSDIFYMNCIKNVMLFICLN